MRKDLISVLLNALSIEDYNELTSYIARLEKENKILRENAENNDKVVDKARWNEMIYKLRCEKAIEYINREDICIDIRDNNLNYISTNELLKILKGENNE